MEEPFQFNDRTSISPVCLFDLNYDKNLHNYDGNLILAGYGDEEAQFQIKQKKNIEDENKQLKMAKFKVVKVVPLLELTCIINEDLIHLASETSAGCSGDSGGG